MTHIFDMCCNSKNYRIKAETWDEMADKATELVPVGAIFGVCVYEEDAQFYQRVGNKSLPISQVEAMIKTLRR